MSFKREKTQKPSALYARAKKFTTTTTVSRRHESCPLFLDSQRHLERDRVGAAYLCHTFLVTMNSKSRIHDLNLT